MPNPKNYDNQADWMSACVPARIDEGNPQKQAVAACLNIWRNRNKKEMEMDEKAVWSTAMINNLPDSAFLYVEPGGEKDGEGKTVPRSKRHLPYKNASGSVDLPHLRNAISRLGQSGTGKGWMSEGLRTRLLARARRILAGQQKSALDRAVEWLKEAFGVTEKETDQNPFMVWKDDETGVYRWLAVYSNKWRDEDNPPEILSSQSHRDFVEAVDKAEWPQPEAWLWHVPGTRFGVADYVAYDESGFALASGTIDEGQERVAEFLMAQDDLAMSHGMPVKEIERDTEDSTIITRYRSLEISPLPREAAANRYGTAIEVLREVKMAIPEKKRAFLADAMGEKGLQDLEDRLADKAKELEELEIQSKEEDAESAVEEPLEEVVEEESEPKEETEPQPEPEPEPIFVTAEEVADAVGRTMKPLFEQLAALEERIEEQAKELKELKKGDDERLKEELANTPAASLFDRIGSVIGSDETYVDGRTTLGKAGPEERQDEDEGPTHVGILNELFAQSWARQ